MPLSYAVVWLRVVSRESRVEGTSLLGSRYGIRSGSIRVWQSYSGVVVVVGIGQ